MCRCNVKLFDANRTYRTNFPHVNNLKTYAWKPIIIQVSFFHQSDL